MFIIDVRAAHSHIFTCRFVIYLIAVNLSEGDGILQGDDTWGTVPQGTVL